MTKKSTGNTTCGLKVVALADGRKQVVPSGLVLINPDREGKAQYLYYAWGIRFDKPCTFADTARGKGVTSLYGYLTDCKDLYKLGRHDTPMLRTRFEAAKPDYFALASAMIDALASAVPVGVPCTYAFALCDSMGAPVPVGTGYWAERGE